MVQNDVDYYRARATEERRRALASDRQNVAEIHLELARLYDALVHQPAIRGRRCVSLFQKSPWARRRRPLAPLTLWLAIAPLNIPADER